MLSTAYPGSIITSCFDLIQKDMIKLRCILGIRLAFVSNLVTTELLEKP